MGRHPCLVTLVSWRSTERGHNGSPMRPRPRGETGKAVIPCLAIRNDPKQGMFLSQWRIGCIMFKTQDST